jgi:Flp pilus assembly protein TadG
MKVRKLIKNQKGAALVEFAIVLPLLALLVGGLIEFGLLLYNQQVITNASREGARVGIYTRCDSGGNNYDDDDVKDIINGIVQNYCSQHLISFGSNNPPNTTSTGVRGAFQANLLVEVDYNYNFLLPSLLNFGTSKTLKAGTTMKMEQIAPPCS